MDEFWKFFALVSAVNLLLMPAYRSTDFEVHRNWLAVTHTLPIDRWYLDNTSQWTLDYPPFFAYFEWMLSQVAKYVDPKMLVVNNLNYDSQRTVYFQRTSVVVADVFFAFGVLRCLNALKITKGTYQRRAMELVLLWNVGLVFVDHIHFQYNGFLFGILLLSISCLLEERILLSAFLFSALLNFKHIFLYMAPAFGAYFLRFYCMDIGSGKFSRLMKLTVVGVTPFLISFGPFYNQLPQVFSRLFPFKRGLTHSYWAPNFWAIYNIMDKIASITLGIHREGAASNTAGLVQEYEHVFLPTVTPGVTFILTSLFMLPCIVILCYYTEKRDRHKTFIRSVVICSSAAFMFGWHVHEKAILMSLIPLGLLSMTDTTEAKFTYFLSTVGLFSLFPLLFHPDLIIIRYSLYLFYISGMYGQIARVFQKPLELRLYEKVYLLGFIGQPIYEHVFGQLLGFNKTLPFMPLLLTSLYCSVGIMYFFILYYIHLLNSTYFFKTKSSLKLRTKSKKSKLKTKMK